jgi:hypothetical protein
MTRTNVNKEKSYVEGLRKLAESGNSEDLVRYGLFLIVNDSESLDGVNLLKKAADIGSYVAKYELASLSKELRFVSNISDEDMVEYIVFAAKSGHIAAALDLYYHYGDVVPRNDLLESLRAASEGGSSEAARLLRQEEGK